MEITAADAGAAISKSEFPISKSRAFLAHWTLEIGTWKFLSAGLRHV
jgi:hypothetical protein